MAHESSADPVSITADPISIAADPISIAADPISITADPISIAAEAAPDAAAPAAVAQTATLNGAAHDGQAAPGPLADAASPSTYVPDQADPRSAGTSVNSTASDIVEGASLAGPEQVVLQTTAAPPQAHPKVQAHPEAQTPLQHEAAGLPGTQLGSDATPPVAPRRRRATRRRMPTQKIFSDLAAQAAIPASAYAIGEDVDGAMCLVQTDEGFEVFNSIAGARHEVRVFQDEESAYFYLFGVLVAEAVRTGVLAPLGAH